MSTADGRATTYERATSIFEIGSDSSRLFRGALTASLSRMRISHVRLIFVLALSVVRGLQASTPDSAPNAFNVTEVAAGVLVHQGRHAGLDDPGRDDSANIGFVIGRDCVAVIDTGGSVATGTRLLHAIRARTALPVCYVINTHGHFDHILGNAAFVNEHPKFVGHTNLATAVDASREYFLEHFAPELGTNPKSAVIGPDTLVERELTLDLGGRELRLQAQPVAHTVADLTIIDQQTNTLWSGDLVFMERLPVVDGNVKGWLAWMNANATEPYARVIPGHGPASAPWPAAMAAQRDYLTGLIATVKAALSAGEFLEDVTAAGDKAPLAGWQVRAMHTRNLSRVYRELEWE